MKVIAAMSGGVDSSVAAALVRDAGHEVVGITLDTWRCEFDPTPADTRGRACCGISDVAHAREAADTLGIAHATLDARDLFLHQVIETSRAAQREGLTPNPCILCNERVKFGRLLDELNSLGADQLVTGHYARVRPRPDAVPGLYRGTDASKDQGYVLFTLAGDRRLDRIDFPLGEMTKAEVRRRAASLGLANAEKPESQDLCFPVRDPAEDRPGEIVDPDGNVIGTHAGLSLYTVGQHKRIQVPGSSKRFVLSLDPLTNRIVVGDEASLMRSVVRAHLVSWDGEPPRTPHGITAKIRYRQEAAEATAHVEDDTLVVTFAKPQRAVTPGQALVCYDADRVLGGGWIQ